MYAFRNLGQRKLDQTFCFYFFLNFMFFCLYLQVFAMDTFSLSFAVVFTACFSLGVVCGQGIVFYFLSATP